MLVQSLLLLKIMIDEVKIMTDVFCSVDGMACCHGDPGFKMGTAVIHAYPRGSLGEEGFVQPELHLISQ